MVEIPFIEYISKEDQIWKPKVEFRHYVESNLDPYRTPCLISIKKGM